MEKQRGLPEDGLSQRQGWLISGQAQGQVWGLSDQKPSQRQCAPFPGTTSPTPESSYEVHMVTVIVFIELDTVHNVQGTTHISGDHISKHVSHPHKDRGPKGRTRNLQPRQSIGNCCTHGTFSPLGKDSRSELWQAEPTPTDRVFWGGGGLHCT